MNALRLFALVALALSLIALDVPQAAAQAIDQNFYYKLSTQFRGPGMCLDIFNGGPNNNQPYLKNCGNFTGQRWTLAKTTKHVPQSGCARCNDDSCQCGDFTRSGSELCANHGGENPNLGCIKQPHSQ